MMGKGFSQNRSRELKVVVEREKEKASTGYRRTDSHSSPPPIRTESSRELPGF